ncbi:putative histidine kinase [Methanocella paludicola SANAE]|uniref:histidine kinase n=1 Tax=Methanocella paludicola (strain DSM 17711 / JCM 13418 / NBRC 101707 / SANAE) TaxID=304371 RepID=D1YZV8_METPS|nr:putative histidine kinase [Methanocella paludicola SANAE]
MKTADADKYHFLFDSIQDIAYFLRLDGSIIEVNDAAVRAYGYSRDELPSMNIAMLRTDEERKKLPGMLERCYKYGCVYQTVHRRKDGSTFPLEVNSRGIILDGEKAIVGIARDITERQRAADSLRKSQALLNNIFNCIQDGLTVLDIDLNVVRHNPTIEKWHGRDLVGKKCYRLFHGRNEPCENCPSIRAVREKSMQREVVHDLIGWKELYAYPLVNDDGDVAGTVEQVRDITDRIQADSILRNAMAESELYVDLMGHDINNMNQITLGFMELARNIIEYEGKLTSDNLYLLDKAMDSIKNSSLLIDNVRKIQREKRGLYEPRIMDVSTVLSDVVEQHLDTPGRRVRIDFTPVKGFTVKANDLLKDVFINLVGNAIKHSTGDLTINISLYRVVKAGKEYVGVSVEDNGPGITDQMKQTLLELDLTHTKSRGKGFGLCLIKMLLEDFNGEFWVEDRVNGDFSKGARFVVTLPIANR